MSQISTADKQPGPYSGPLVTRGKFIQIAASGGPDGHDLYALDEHGIVWRFIFGAGDWISLPRQRGV